MTRRASTLIGSTVSVKGGTALGKVVDIAIGEEGTVDYLIVRSEGRLMAVPWGAVSYTAGATTVTVVTPIQRERLKDVTFEESTWPDFYTEKWRKSAGTVWGEKTLRRPPLKRKPGTPPPGSP